MQLPLALAITGPDGVVVGNVQVHGLAWQPINQRCEVFVGDAGGVFDADALLGVVQDGQQMLDQRLGVLRVPLQGARKAGVVEIGQGAVEPRAQPAHFGHHLRWHVLETRQRLTVNVVEQAYPQRLAINLHGQQVFAAVRRTYCGHRQAVLTQVGEGGMLRLQLHLGVAVMTGLEHELPSSRVDPEVQVLLTAQCRQPTGNAVVHLQQGMRLGFAERGAWQAGALDQLFEGRGDVFLLLTGHGLYRWSRGDSSDCMPDLADDERRS
ncbi:hypothetical protein D9M71_500930 [compost metagenome]